MAPVNESAVPPAHRARDAFLKAMEQWDEAAADAAVAGLARSAGANEVFEIFARLGPRDFRSIGHKAIYVANAWRTLHCIGWQHAEPVLRSLAYALLNHEGEPNPAASDLAPDRPARQNLELAKTFRADWLAGRVDSGATREMLVTLRDGSSEDACKAVTKIINDGIHPQSVFDGLLVGAGELLMRQPGIVSLHAVTSTNALRYLFEASDGKETRQLALLQNAAFLPLFREAMKARGQIGNQRIDDLRPADTTPAGDDAIGNIFADVGRDGASASRKVLAYLNSNRSPEELMTAARRLVFLKGSDSHDYKFSSAVLEDYYHASPEWRNLYLSTSVFRLNGTTKPDNQLVQRIRSALTA